MCLSSGIGASRESERATVRWNRRNGNISYIILKLFCKERRMFIRVSFKIITLMTEILSFFQQDTERRDIYFSISRIYSISDCTHISPPAPGGWRPQRSAVNVHVLCVWILWKKKLFISGMSNVDVGADRRHRRQKEVLTNTFFKIWVYYSWGRVWTWRWAVHSQQSADACMHVFVSQTSFLRGNLHSSQ